MTATRARRPQAVEAAARDSWLTSVLTGCGLADVDPSDVLSVHVGVRSIGIRRKVRGRSGKVVPGHTLTTSHDVIHEPLED